MLEIGILSMNAKKASLTNGPQSRTLYGKLSINSHYYQFYSLLSLAMLVDEPVREKTNNLGSDQVRHKPGCTVTEAG